MNCDLHIGTKELMLKSATIESIQVSKIFETERLVSTAVHRLKKKKYIEGIYQAWQGGNSVISSDILPADISWQLRAHQHWKFLINAVTYARCETVLETKSNIISKLVCVIKGVTAIWVWDVSKRRGLVKGPWQMTTCFSVSAQLIVATAEYLRTGPH